MFCAFSAVRALFQVQYFKGSEFAFFAAPTAHGFSVFLIFRLASSCFSFILQSVAGKKRFEEHMNRSVQGKLSGARARRVRQISLSASNGARAGVRSRIPRNSDSFRADLDPDFKADLVPVKIDLTKGAPIGAIKKMRRCSLRPSPAGGGMVVAASGKDFQAPCRRDRVSVRKDFAAPTALGRIELKIPMKFSTRFGNGRTLFSGPAKVLTGGGAVNMVCFQPTESNLI